MSTVGKTLLSNHLRHAESHNKIKEERGMWQQREVERKKERFCDDWSFRASLNITPLVRGHLISDAIDPSLSSSSPSPPSSSQSRSVSPAHSSNYWTRQLMKAEEADPFRWGHSGYKEHHPEEFHSSSESEEDDRVRKKIKKKKKKKSGMLAKKFKHKKKEMKHEISKHKRKRRPVPSSDSETSSSSYREYSSGTKRKGQSGTKKRGQSGTKRTGQSSKHKSKWKKQKIVT